MISILKAVYKKNCIRGVFRALTIIDEGVFRDRVFSILGLSQGSEYASVYDIFFIYCR